MSILGVNIGITRCTAAVYNDDGQLLWQGKSNYTIKHPVPGALELDPGQVMQSIQAAIREAVRGAPDRDPVRALSFATLGESIIPVDQKGQPLGPALLTFDTRPTPETAWLAERIGSDRLHQITSLPLHPMYSLPKMLWWKNHHPEIYERTAKFLCFGGLFLQRLGMDPVMDYSMAGRTLALDLPLHRWSSEILEAAKISFDLLPDLVQAGSLLGIVPKRIAKELELPGGVRVVLGGHDQACGSFGCGALSAGTAMDATGAVECLAPTFAQPVINQRMQDDHFGCYPHVIPGRYLSLAYNFTGGALLRWYRDTLGALEDEEARVSGLKFYDILIGKASRGPSPLLVLPHFTPTDAPWREDAGVGAMVGLTLTTSKAQIIKGMFDGLAYEMRRQLDRLADAGANVERIRVVGAGANSQIWLQLKANVYQRPVEGIDVPDALTLGAAMLAGIGSGKYADADDAVAHAVPTVKAVEPDADDVPRYAEQYQRFLRLYPALQPVV